MRPNSILVPVLFLAGASAGWCQEVSIEGRFHDGSPVKDVHKRPTASAELAPAPELRMEALEVEQTRAAQPLREARRVGRVRAMAADAVEKGSWTALADGRFVWRLTIRSPEATELRIHFADFHAGAGKVWVYADGSAQPGRQFTGDGLFGDGDFWSSIVLADRVTIEYLAEDGLRHDAPPFQIAEVGHLWEATSSIVTESATVPSPKLSLAPPAAAASGLGLTPGREIAGCHLDVACFPEYRNVATGVARIIFAVEGGLYVCSGALVNTKSGNGTPLFLTASHCIDNEASARSVQANFFYESESCGGGLRQVEDVLGGNYLVSETFSRGDYSLIRLLGLPKSPVYFFGLTTEEPAIGTKLAGIHHPQGSYKRISFGPRTADESIGVSSGSGVFISPADRYYQVDQREGRTEGGSSGSPLLNANKQIVGTLSSGPVFSAVKAEDEVLLCLATEVIDQYGRVSKAWPGLEPFVNDLRKAQIAIPQTGDKFTARKVTFQWSPGVGVTEYRFLLGKTKGGGEYADVTLRGATSFTADNLPEDGSAAYGRLMSRVDSKWEIVDYSYLTSSGSPARAAKIVSPAVDAQLASSRVEFKWDEGSNASEYILNVGLNPGGGDFARGSVGKRTSAVVDNLPGDGQTTVYARLHSRVGDRWIYNDAVYRAAGSQSKTFTLKISNRLAYPVNILVNERSVMSVLGGQSAEQTLPRGGEVTVEWRLVRPAHPVTGIALGESLGAAFAPVVPGEALTYEITHSVNGATYFTPIVSNASRETFYVEVNNGTPTRAGLGAIPPGTANAGLGYYRVQLTGSVRGYYGLYGYTGPFVETPRVAGRLEPESGVVQINLAVPAGQ